MNWQTRELEANSRLADAAAALLGHLGETVPQDLQQTSGTPQERRVNRLEAAAEALERAALSQVKPGLYEALVAAYGPITLADLRKADDDTLQAVNGIGPSTVRELRELLGQVETETLSHPHRLQMPDVDEETDA